MLRVILSKRPRLALAMTALALLAIPALPARGVPWAETSRASEARHQQDLTFRLINLERLVESLQVRIDILERTTRAMPSVNQVDSAAHTPASLEIQRQILSLAEQQILMQTQLLELRKTLDRLSEKPPATGSRPSQQPPPPAARRP